MRVTNHDRRAVVVAERVLGRRFYQCRRVVEGLRPPMRRPRRRAAGTEEIGRDDAMIRSERVTERRPLLVARTAAVDRDDGGSGAPDRVFDAEARRRRHLEVDASLGPRRHLPPSKRKRPRRPGELLAVVARELQLREVAELALLEPISFVGRPRLLGAISKRMIAMRPPVVAAAAVPGLADQDVFHELRRPAKALGPVDPRRHPRRDGHVRALRRALRVYVLDGKRRREAPRAIIRRGDLDGTPALLQRASEELGQTAVPRSDLDDIQLLYAHLVFRRDEVVREAVDVV